MADAGSDLSLLRRSLRRQLALAALLVILLVGGLGGWSARTSLSGAVIAPGTVAVKGNSKRVQHRDGGIIRTIRVRNGDKVQSGDVLVELDDTESGATLAAVEAQLFEAEARQARLQAEREGSPSPAYSVALEASAAESAARASVLEGQAALLTSRTRARDSRRERIAEQIAQFGRQMEGLEAQRAAKAEEVALIEDELGGVEGLLGQGLVTKARINTLRREHARLKGALGGLVAEIARVGGAIAEKRLEISQIDENFSEAVLNELQEVRNLVAGLRERRVAALDRQARSRILAPQSGVIHQLAVHTEGGVIAPGQTLMRILPQDQSLVVTARARPTDIDQLREGQPARLRLSALDQRTTPDLEGRVTTISADLALPEETLAGAVPLSGAAYAVEIAIMDTRPETAAALVPGMPVEVFMETEPRTVLSYVLRPLADQIAHAFRE